MPSRIARSLLFLSSYAPLFLIFSFQLFEEHKRAAFGFLLLALLSLGGLILFLKWKDRSAPRQVTVTSVQTKDSELMAYIVSYIFPYMGIDFSKPANYISLGLFFLILMVIYVNSNIIHINPTLNLLGFHIFEIDDEASIKHTLICKKERLHRGDRVRVAIVGDNILMENR